MRVVTTRTNQHDRMLLEAARQACLQAAADAYEDAGIRGLCGDGRWEYALGAIRALDLEAVADVKALVPRDESDDRAPAP